MIAAGCIQVSSPDPPPLPPRGLLSGTLSAPLGMAVTQALVWLLAAANARAQSITSTCAGLPSKLQVPGGQKCSATKSCYTVWNGQGGSLFPQGVGSLTCDTSSGSCVCPSGECTSSKSGFNFKCCDDIQCEAGYISNNFTDTVSCPAVAVAAPQGSFDPRS